MNEIVLPTPPPALPPVPPRRRLRWALPLALLIVAGLVYGGLRAVRWWEEMHRLELESRSAAAAYLEHIDGAWGAIAPLTGREQALLRRSTNKKHVETGRRLGITPAKTRAEAAERVGDLVRIGTDSLVVVTSQTYGVPFMTPRARDVVDSIAVRFQQRLLAAGLPRYKPVITSILRTQEDQAALRQVNVNAARGTSSHEFATTFDLHTERFVYAAPPPGPMPMPSPRLPAWWRRPLVEELKAEAAERFRRDVARNDTRLKAALGRTLIEMENEGRLITVMEMRQPVFHTTAIGWEVGD